ncbi:invasion associated locus B family protein [Xanthobacter variabilis]|uniref:invasion associated locus B family protein n=2 Tax=Xanthobacter variabilis TaxID=3119932 RepID=UPI00372BD73F
MISMSRKDFLPKRASRIAKAAGGRAARLFAGKALVSVLALGGALMLQGVAAHAENATPATPPSASETRSTHGDWIVRCKKDVSPKECEAVQTLQTTDLKGVLAHVAVRAQHQGPVRLIVLTPPGVWLPANVTLKVGGVPDIALTYKRCGQYCVASVELTQENIAALKASSGQGDLTFENGSRNPIILPVSFKGLGEAMEASLKD